MKLPKLKDIVINENIEKSEFLIENISKRDIAIIGMSGRFAGASSIKEYWDILKDGIDCIGDVPVERKKDIKGYLSASGLTDERKEEPVYSQMGYLKDIDKFDYQFFSISPKEASLMDPNQRMFLETAWKAVEDSGIGVDNLKGTNTGVFLGYNTNSLWDYKHLIFATDPKNMVVANVGNIKAVIPSRVSYMMDLKGPAILVDTTCSSSLVAVHLACQSIRKGECEMAIVGGSSINLLSIKDSTSGDMGIESSSARAKTFDDISDGTGMGEGVMAILLKPLWKAMEDRDNIYAVIKGSAMNQDGNSIGITAPNCAAQEEVIAAAWKDAGIEPETISLIEAHGTGTKLGDPIEVEGISRAFRKYTTKKQFCAIGSVKTNLGHLDGAAGIAGLVKAVLSLKNKKIPPTLHFNHPNRKIPFEDSPVYINDSLTDWKADGLPRRCGVSAFGLSGTNCHIILEDMSLKSTANLNCKGQKIFTLSAKSEESLQALVNAYGEYLNSEANNLESICYTANTGRGHYSYRLALLVSDMDDLRRKINRLGQSTFWAAAEMDLFFGRNSVVNSEKHFTNDGDMTLEQKSRLDKMTLEKVNELHTFDSNQQLEIMREICRLYIKGADVQWKEIYKGRKISKTSLPTYPFERNRCWVKGTETEASANMFHRILWEAREIKNMGCTIPKAGIVLLFKDEKSISDELIKNIRMQGLRTIEVAIGTGFQRINENKYMLGNTQKDYERLISEISSQNICKVIHVSSIKVKQGVNEINQLQNALLAGVYSIFDLVKALANHKQKQVIDFCVVSENANEVTGKESIISPENAAIFGLAKVVDTECRNLKIKCIDLDENTRVELIYAELESDSDVQITAYRNNIRYEAVLDEILIDSMQSNRPIYKEHGVYIVTGGAGGIGLEICKHMASKARVRLALINRTKMPERAAWESILKESQAVKLTEKLNKIKAIEQMGSSVDFYSADVANYEEMEQICIHLRGKYGKINGIIHSAGVAGDGILIRKDEELFCKVLRPKIQGTWVLDRLTREDALDFFILFSSTATLHGGYGQGDYTAANAYLDSFAAYRNKLGQRTQTINWTAWRETGMAFDHGVTMDSIIKAISNQKAVEAFETIVNRDFKNVIVGEVDLNMLSQRMDHLNLNLNLSDVLLSRIKKNITSKRGKTAEIRNQPVESEKVELTGGKVDGYTQVQKDLAQVWSAVLGVKTVSIYNNFYELGGDSILAIQLSKVLNEKYPGVLSVSDVFSYPTIDQLSDYIEKELNKEKNVNANHLDDILDKLAAGSLSTDEAAALFRKVEEEEWNL